MNHNSPVYIRNFSERVVDEFKSGVWRNKSKLSIQLGTPFSNHFAGVNNPHWKEKIRSHSDASTPYSASECKILGHKNHSCFFTYTSYYGYRVVVDDAQIARYMPTNLDYINTSAVENAARTKFYNNMSSAFSAGTFVGELGQTIKMLRRPALALRKAVDTYTTRAEKLRASLIREARFEKQRLISSSSALLANRSRREAWARELALKNAHKKYRTLLPELYLEHAFGWMPLFQDIESVFDRLKELLEEPGIERFRARSSMKVEVPKRVVATLAYDYWRGTCYLTEHQEIQVQYKGAVYSQKHHNLTLTEKFSVSPGDLIVTGWNLLPHSFLFDYFANIGDVLNATVLYQRIKYVYCNRTIRVNNRCFGQEVGSTLFPVKWNRNEAGALLVKLKKVKRDPVNSVPIPSLTLKIPHTLSKGLNLASLLALKAEGKEYGSRVRL